jgi:hypothetical protein
MASQGLGKRRSGEVAVHGLVLPSSGSRRVASRGVAAPSGGEVALPVPPEDADGQGLRGLAMARGVRSFKASLAKGTSRR